MNNKLNTLSAIAGIIALFISILALARDTFDYKISWNLSQTMSSNPTEPSPTSKVFSTEVSQAYISTVPPVVDTPTLSPTPTATLTTASTTSAVHMLIETHTLYGDLDTRGFQIWNFRVVQDTHDQLVVEADYTYDGSFSGLQLALISTKGFTISYEDPYGVKDIVALNDIIINEGSGTVTFTMVKKEGIDRANTTTLVFKSFFSQTRSSKKVWVEMRTILFDYKKDWH